MKVQQLILFYSFPLLIFFLKHVSRVLNFFIDVSDLLLEDDARPDVPA